MAPTDYLGGQCDVFWKYAMLDPGYCELHSITMLLSVKEWWDCVVLFFHMNAHRYCDLQFCAMGRDLDSICTYMPQVVAQLHAVISEGCDVTSCFQGCHRLT